jgi:hypothetical protein
MVTGSCRRLLQAGAGLTGAGLGVVAGRDFFWCHRQDGYRWWNAGVDSVAEQQGHRSGQAKDPAGMTMIKSFYTPDGVTSVGTEVVDPAALT